MFHTFKTTLLLGGNFQSVRIDLGDKNVRQTVCTILEKCNLPTSYVDSLPQKFSSSKQSVPYPFRQGPMSSTGDWRPPNAKRAEEEIKKKKATQDNLELSYTVNCCLFICSESMKLQF